MNPSSMGYSKSKVTPKDPQDSLNKVPNNKQQPHFPISVRGEDERVDGELCVVYNTIAVLPLWQYCQRHVDNTLTLMDPYCSLS